MGAPKVKTEPISPEQAVQPVCPHCKMSPAEIRLNEFPMNDLVCVAIYCANPKCRKIHSIQVVGRVQQKVVPASPLIHQ